MNSPASMNGGRENRVLHAFSNSYAAFSGALAQLLLWTVVSALIITLGCISLQVFMRYFLGAPPSWAEEIAMLAFSWSALGGLALGVREGFHVRIELLNFTSPALRGVWERVLNLLIAAFGLFLAWAGWRFVEMTAGGRSAAMRYPLELLHIMAPIVGFLLLVFALERAFGAQPASRPDSEMQSS